MSVTVQTAAIAIGDLFAAGEVAFIMAIGAILGKMTTNRAKKGLKKLFGLSPTQARRLKEGEGAAVLLAAPGPSHQEIRFEICRQVGNFLEGKKCKAYAAPFDVRLFEREGDSPENVDTVIQPDITVICDRSKIDERGCKGAPDVAIEILSPSTQRHDRLVKFNLYQQSGLGELWFVDPANRCAEVFLRDGQGMLRPVEVYRPKDIAKLSSLEGCFIEMGKVFPEG